MSKFKPIFEKKQEKPKEDSSQRIAEQKKILEGEVSRLRSENSSLKDEVERLRKALQEKEKEIEGLRGELERSKTLERLFGELRSSIGEALKKVKEDLKEDFVKLSKEVIREFLMTDLVPKEAVVTTVLEEVFEKMADVRGRTTVYLSPKDVDMALDTLGEIREKIGDRVEIEVVSDPGLEKGEVRVETPKFVIERRHDEVFEEVFREVMRRVSERGKDIREGGQGKRDIP